MPAMMTRFAGFSTGAELAAAQQFAQLVYETIGLSHKPDAPASEWIANTHLFKNRSIVFYSKQGRFVVAVCQ